MSAVKRKKASSNIGEWTRVGTLPKVTTFRFNSKKSPADSLHARIRKLLPEIQSISQVACSPRTNEYLRRKLVEYGKKHSIYRGRKLETAVAFTMLDMSPLIIFDTLDDFVMNYSGDATVFATADTFAACFLATDGSKWRLTNNGASVQSLAFRFTRTNGHLVLE